jgi:hypothetical protein
MPRTASQEESEGWGEDVRACLHEEGALQGTALRCDDQPAGGVLRGPHLALGGGQHLPHLDEEVAKRWEMPGSTGLHASLSR